MLDLVGRRRRRRLRPPYGELFREMSSSSVIAIDLDALTSVLYSLSIVPLRLPREIVSFNSSVDAARYAMNKKNQFTERNSNSLVAYVREISPVCTYTLAVLVGCECAFGTRFAEFFATIENVYIVIRTNNEYLRIFQLFLKYILGAIIEG